MTTTSGTVEIPTAGSYRLDPTGSSITFATRHMFGLGGVTGSVSLVSGEINVAEPISATTMDITASAASFGSGQPKRDTKVTSATFLDAANHPHITFHSGGLVQEGGAWIARGTLTVRGTTAPLDLIVTDVSQDPAGVRAEATATVDRYAFGVTAMKGMAGRRLTLTIKASLTRV